MNDNHSQHEWIYIPRWLTERFADALQNHPVIILTGPRQVGKSTFLQNIEPVKNWPQLSMDNLDVLEQAQKNPNALLTGKRQFVIDEVQKSPQILSEIKRYVDARRREVSIVLTGSANILLMKNVTETLAGRAVLMTMDSMAWRETRGQKPVSTLQKMFEGQWQSITDRQPMNGDLLNLIFRGSLPPLLFFDTEEAIVQWWEGYVATFLERDLRLLSQIDSLPDFRRLMVALALRSAQVLNQTEVSRDIGMPQPTVNRYINLLEIMHLFYRVPAFAVNRTKRLIKSPKAFWFDSGLATFLSGYYSSESLNGIKQTGGLFETFVFQQLRVWASLQIPKSRIYFWRTVTGKEVDFVLEKGRQILGIEVKNKADVGYRDAENLRLFLHEYADIAQGGIIVYNGSEVKPLDEKIIAIPWYLLV